MPFYCPSLIQDIISTIIVDMLIRTASHQICTFSAPLTCLISMLTQLFPLVQKPHIWMQVKNTSNHIKHVTLHRKWTASSEKKALQISFFNGKMLQNEYIASQTRKQPWLYAWKEAINRIKMHKETWQEKYPPHP